MLLSLCSSSRNDGFTLPRGCHTCWTGPMKSCSGREHKQPHPPVGTQGHFQPWHQLFFSRCQKWKQWRFSTVQGSWAINQYYSNWLFKPIWIIIWSTSGKSELHYVQFKVASGVISNTAFQSTYPAFPQIPHLFVNHSYIKTTA